MTRNFADLSSNNGPNALNAHEYASTGHVLLAVKLSQGTHYIDPYWATQVHEAHLAHVSCLSYHFAEPGDAREQAEFFLQHLKASGEFHSYDAIALDLEREQGISDPAAFKDAFDAQCISDGQKNLIVYTELSYHEEYGLAPRNGRLWIADYGAGFLEQYWADQYSDHANVHGINGPCDVSRLSLSAYLYHRLHKP